MQTTDLRISAAAIARTADTVAPITVTFPTAKRLTGLGLTSLWKLAKEKRIEIVRVGRRTLITYRSLAKIAFAHAD